MKTSITLPAISNTTVNTNPVYSNQKGSYSSYAISDCDNPFKPDGELAKEAEEFVHEFQEKKEQEVAEIIKQQTSSSSLKPEVTQTEGSDVKDVLVEVAPGSPAKANGDAVAVPDAKAEETSVENKDVKKKKTKSKCGCTIS